MRQDHNPGCASLQPTPKCDCLRGAWRRAKRRAANFFKRNKVTIVEKPPSKDLPPWITPCPDCGELVHIQALTTNEHECKSDG